MSNDSNQVDSSQVLARVFDKTKDSLKTCAPDDIENMDEASATVTYFGYARPGSLEAQPVWRIYRREVTGNVVRIRWANGDSTYTNIWSVRDTLTYS